MRSVSKQGMRDGWEIENVCRPKAAARGPELADCIDQLRVVLAVREADRKAALAEGEARQRAARRRRR